MQPVALTLSTYQLKTDSPERLEIRFVPTLLMRYVPMGLLGLLGLLVFLLLALLYPVRTELRCSHAPVAQCSQTQVFLLRRSSTAIPLKQIEKVSVESKSSKNGTPYYPVQLQTQTEGWLWQSADSLPAAEQTAQTLRAFLANPQAAPVEQIPASDYLAFGIFVGFFGLGSWLLLRYFYQVLSGSLTVDRSKGHMEARLWSKNGPQFQRFEISEIDRFRVESHGPICLIWMEVKAQTGPWILTWGMSTGEGLRLEEKLSDYLNLD